VRVLAQFAADYLALSALSLLAFVSICLPPHTNLDDESAHVAVADDVSGLDLISDGASRATLASVMRMRLVILPTTGSRSAWHLHGT
jgi:hypothetical protein